MPAEELRGSRVTSSLARKQSNDRPTRQATGFCVASGRVALWALAALFVSGCRELDPIDRAGWLAYLGGFLVALAVWSIVDQLRALRTAKAWSALRAAADAAEAADRRFQAAASVVRAQVEAGRNDDALIAEADRLMPGWRLKAVKNPDLVAFQHFGNLPAVLLVLALSAGVGDAQVVPDVPVVSAPAVQRELDSLRLATDATGRYCGTAGARQYMLTACQQLAGVRFRLVQLLETPFRVKADTIWMPATVPGVVASSYYASGVPGKPVPGVDTVTVCALLHFPDHSEKVGWPPVRLTVLAGDSAVLVARFGNPLGQMCAILTDRNAMRDSVPVIWSMVWTVIDGRRMYRPAWRVVP